MVQCLRCEVSGTAGLTLAAVVVQCLWSEVFGKGGLKGRPHYTLEST